MRPRLHYDWHWDFNTGNGDVGNQGPHEWDLMNWALGDHPDLPTSMVAAGNRFGWRDAGNTPNVMACLGVLRDIPFCFEVMDLKTKCPPPFNKGVGVIIRTEQGRFVGGRGGGKFTFDNGKEENFARAEWQKNADGLPAHMQNFIDAVAANDYRLLKSDCAIAANSSAMAHMANISYQMGQTADRSALANAFASTPESQEMLERLYSAPTQFAAETGQSGDAVQWQLGPVLTFDSQTHQFTGERAEEANKAMKRDYRAGYELPDVS
jgi:predicted dehydrogenase